MVAGMEETQSPRPTPRYRKVVDGSAGVARGMGHSYVGVEHLFLAIIRERGAVPTQVLGGLIDLDRVEAALLGEMGSAGYRGQTPPPSTQ
jgi:Clp amino terminal domain, pathogenicity island component